MTVVVRLAMIALRRFTREPETRRASSRHLLTAAIRLHAGETSPGDAALACAETLRDIAVATRSQKEDAA